MALDPATKDVLIALAEEIKIQRFGLSKVIQEVGALRETVRGLDPTFDAVLEQKRQETSTAEIEKQAILLIDQLIAMIRSLP